MTTMMKSAFAIIPGNKRDWIETLNLVKSIQPF